jgi:hypothetical protein
VPRDNAAAETFFATIKRDLIDSRAWATRAELRRAVFEHIEGGTTRAGCTRSSAISARCDTKPFTKTPTLSGMINTINRSVEPDQAQSISLRSWSSIVVVGVGRC